MAGLGYGGILAGLEKKMLNGLGKERLGMVLLRYNSIHCYIQCSYIYLVTV